MFVDSEARLWSKVVKKTSQKLDRPDDSPPCSWFDNRVNEGKSSRNNIALFCNNSDTNVLQPLPTISQPDDYGYTANKIYRPVPEVNGKSGKS